jgi:pimeloyl-ACP methyl ester carboxylesterase
MATFALIHGGGDVGWYWHLVEAALRQHGHDVVAPDLPCEDDTATLSDYADTVIEAIDERRDLVVVGQSFGGFTAALVAGRLPVDALVFVTGMVPAPGETPADWWENTGYRQAAEEQARLDGGLTGSDDPFVAFYNGVPRALAEEAMSKERSESNAAYNHPCPQCRRGSCCARRTGSSPPRSCVGWCPSGSVSCPTRSLRATVWR